MSKPFKIKTIAVVFFTLLLFLHSTFATELRAPNECEADLVESISHGWNSRVQIGDSCVVYSFGCVLESILKTEVSVAYWGARFALQRIAENHRPPEQNLSPDQILEKFGFIEQSQLSLSKKFREFFMSLLAVKEPIRDEDLLAAVAESFFDASQIEALDDNPNFKIFKSEVRRISKIAKRDPRISNLIPRFKTIYSLDWPTQNFFSSARQSFARFLLPMVRRSVDLLPTTALPYEEVMERVRDNLKNEIGSILGIELGAWYKNGVAPEPEVLSRRTRAEQLLRHLLKIEDNKMHAIAVVAYKPSLVGYTYLLLDTQLNSGFVGPVRITDSQLKKILFSATVYK